MKVAVTLEAQATLAASVVAKLVRSLADLVAPAVASPMAA
jgi:hypothetical protein